MFGGKGGVGKTTCAAATALFLSRQLPDEEFLLVSFDPAHSLKDVFAGSAPPSNLRIEEFDSRKCLKEFKDAHAHHLREIARRGTFLDEQDIEHLLDLSMPGLDEIMAFNEIARIVERGTYRCIIADTAPTGHTLRFLELPRTLRTWVNALDAMLAKHRYMIKLYQGFRRKDETDMFLEDMAASVEGVDSLFSDPLRCRFVPVAVPEFLIVQETRRLIDRLKMMGIPVTDILLNRVYPDVSDCPACTDARARQGTQVREFCQKFSAYRLWQIPLQGAEVLGVNQLSCFWDDIRTVEDCPGTPFAAASVPPSVECPAKPPGPGKSLLLFAGKGGVGKTTLASASAVHLAREHPEKQVLLFSTDPAHSLSDCFGVEIGPQETYLFPGLSAIEVDAQAEFQNLKTLYAEEAASVLNSLTGGKWIDLGFDRDVIERVLDISPPGLDEAMALTRLIELREDSRYDVFVIDTAPTGHLLRLLEMPNLIQDWLKVFFGLFLKYKNVFRLPRITELMVAMSKRLKLIQSLLTDSHRSQLCAVSILTEMAFEETKDLIKACVSAGIHVPVLFLNQATPPSRCSLCSAIAQKESRVRVRFEAAFPKIRKTVIYQGGDLQGIDQLDDLGSAIYAGKQRMRAGKGAI